MNKYTLIPIIALIVIIAAVGGYMVLSSSQSPVSESPSVSSRETSEGQAADTGDKMTEDSMSEKTSLKNLMMTLVNQKCTFTDTESGSGGVVYIAKGSVRGDFTTQNEGSTVESHMISNEKEAYIWMDGLQTGIKLELDAMEDVNDTGFNNAPKTVDINETVDYSCTPWVPDESKFVLPTDRSFTDMSAAMEDVMESVQELQPGQDDTGTLDLETACAACDQTPEEYREQCRAALGC